MKFKKAVLIGIEESVLSSDTYEELDKLVEIRVTVELNDSARLLAEVADADCFLVDFLATVSKETIDAAPNLKYIGLLANAYERVDVEYAASKNIPVCNLHGFTRETTSELVIAMALIALRRLDQEIERGKNKNFVYTEENIENRRDLHGLNFGIIGLGSIGSRVAELASAFGCRVNYNSLHKKEVPFQYMELDELIASSDVLSLNLNFIPSSRHMLNADRINSLRPGCVVVLANPIALVDTDALASRLAKGDITFVTDDAEVMTKDEIDKLSAYSNCMLYPPLGSVTINSKKNKQTIFVKNIEAALSGQPQNQVNKS